MAQSLLDELAPSIRSLIDEGKIKILRERRGQSFDDWLVEAESDAFDLLIIRDRGEVTLEIRPRDKTEWHDLRNVLAFLQHEPTGKENEALSAALVSTFQDISKVMLSNLSENGFLEFERRRSENLLKKLFP